jgi:hypothetical protein
MDNTKSLFNDRISEIEFYFSILQKTDNGIINLPRPEIIQLERILKSNFILMLYNFVEASVVSGLLEIYSSLKNESRSYTALRNELQILWSNHEIDQIYTSRSGKPSYEKRVQEIIKHILSNQPITFKKEMVKISGNLDANMIKKLCDKHGIKNNAFDNKDYLKIVKDKRNNLAHGDESFGDCSKDFTVRDLEVIKNTVINFIQDILSGMQEYYDQKLYLQSNEAIHV